MPDLDPEELKSRLEISEHKRILLKKTLSQKSMDEETPLWGMVDIMTLLLVFTLFLYASSVKRTFSVVHEPTQSQPVLQGNTPVPLQEPAEIAPHSESNQSQSLSASPLNKSKRLDKAILRLRSEVLNAVNRNEKGLFSVRREQNRLVIVLGERITFRKGEATLLGTYQNVLKKIADFIASKPDFQVMVSGHTDNTPINTETFPSNLDLSAARAINVAKFLIKNDVSPRRVSIQGFSEYRPLFENTSPENRQANRRVEISLINEKNQKGNVSTNH